MNKLKIYILLLICSGLLLNACEKTFFEDEIDIGKLETVDNIRLVLNGGWEQLNSRYYWDQYFKMISRADDITMYYNFHSGGYSYYQRNSILNPFTIGLPRMDFGNENHIHYKSNPVYTSSYRALASFNKIIEFYNGKELSVDERSLIGEAYMARGYIYFILTRFFNQIPLVTDIEVSYSIPLSDMDDSYAQIIADLEKAAELLPDVPVTGRTKGDRLCKGTAKAILAEVYLAMGGYPLYDETKYAKAAATANDVIASAGQYGYGLMSDYKDVIKYVSNKETILNLTIDRLAIKEFESGWSDYSFYPEWTFYNQHYFDYRKKCSINSEISYTVNYPGYQSASRSYLITLDIDTVSFERGPDFIVYYEFGYKKLKMGDFIKDSNLPDPSFSLIRYAHTLLTFAESKARLGELDASAYEAVNLIRRRANHLPIEEPSSIDLENLSADQFLDSVLVERKNEFCAEPFGRWFDIIRLNLLDEVESQRHPREIKLSVMDEIFPEGGYFSFIPESDLKLNPLLKNDTN